MKAAAVDKAWFLSQIAEKGLSVRAVARRMSIDPSALSRSLSSARKLKPEEITRLADILEQPAAKVLEHIDTASGLRPAVKVEGFAEVKQSKFASEPTPKNAPAGEKQPYRHPAWGALKGMITISPDVDLTAPAYEDWKKLYGENH